MKHIPVRFILDDASGSLLKWLRMLGFDTIYHRDFKKSMPEKMCKHEIYLAQSQSIDNKEIEKIIHFEPGSVAAQLKYIMAACGIQRENIRPFSRCIICNQVTQRIDKTVIRGKIPDYVWETHELFRECPACRRIYWPGTHAEKINKTIQEIFQDSSV
jgi:uncharacterized protein with PIN domain